MLLENIIASLFNSSSYFKVVFPNLEENYFVDESYRKVYQKIKLYNEKYSKQPSVSDVKVLIEDDASISESVSESIYELLDEVRTVEKVSDETLMIKLTEEFCQERALENAVIDVIAIMKDKKKPKGLCRDIITKALAVEFDVKIGMDFFKDAPQRYAAYIEHDEVIPTDIEVLNMVCGGGFRKKALACFLGPTNCGKSLILCHLASQFLKQGKNVLYITAEMSEAMITKRIDANLLDIEMNSINETLDKKVFLSKVKEVFSKTEGKLIVKEYPTGSAHAGHIRNLLNEIKIKRGFVPEIILLDYLNIFASFRLGHGAGANSYTYIKTIAEEMRGLAVEFDTAIITATQTNRSGSTQGSEMDMTSTSESFGLPMTVDLLVGIIQTPELFEQNKYCFKVLKSRYNDNINKVYTLGVDRPKMRLLNLKQEDQEIPLHIKDKLKYEKKQENENPDVGFDFS